MNWSTGKYILFIDYLKLETCEIPGTFETPGKLENTETIRKYETFDTTAIHC